MPLSKVHVKGVADAMLATEWRRTGRRLVLQRDVLDRFLSEMGCVISARVSRGFNPRQFTVRIQIETPRLDGEVRRLAHDPEPGRVFAAHLFTACCGFDGSSVLNIQYVDPPYPREPAEEWLALDGSYGPLLDRLVGRTAEQAAVVDRWPALVTGRDIGLHLPLLLAEHGQRQLFEPVAHRLRYYNVLIDECRQRLASTPTEPE